MKYDNWYLTGLQHFPVFRQNSTISKSFKMIIAICQPDARAVQDIGNSAV